MTRTDKKTGLKKFRGSFLGKTGMRLFVYAGDREWKMKRGVRSISARNGEE